MNKVNELVICKKDFESKGEFENAVRDAVMMLLNLDYIMTVKYDLRDKEMGIVVIHYNYANEEFGDRLPVWLLPEEEECVVYKEN